jgi:hypothetical protein
MTRSDDFVTVKLNKVPMGFQLFPRVSRNQIAGSFADRSLAKLGSPMSGALTACANRDYSLADQVRHLHADGSDRAA